MTKVYCTLGPACASETTLVHMIHAGMTGMRLNLSHATLLEAASLVEALHTAEQTCNVQVDLLIDLQGPELRVGVLEAPLQLNPNEEVALDALALPEAVMRALQPGYLLHLDDSTLLLEVTSASHARVVRGGVLQSRKSVALEGAEVLLPALTDHDLANLAVAKSFGVTGVMQPFVRSAEDLAYVREALVAAGMADAQLLAKVEDLHGVEQLESLLPAADEIVIARGDLGSAVPLWELPAIQERIAQTCRAAGKPFMVVTQMLASMEHSPVPTRAEVSDVFRAVVGGAASVMVTGETAIGSYPVEVVRYLANTVREAEQFLARG